MDIIVTAVAILGLIAAFISKVIEKDREDRKRLRMLSRTNEKPWSRSKR